MLIALGNPSMFHVHVPCFLTRVKRHLITKAEVALSVAATKKKRELVFLVKDVALGKCPSFPRKMTLKL